MKNFETLLNETAQCTTIDELESSEYLLNFNTTKYNAYNKRQHNEYYKTYYEVKSEILTKLVVNKLNTNYMKTKEILKNYDGDEEIENVINYVKARFEDLKKIYKKVS